MDNFATVTHSVKVIDLGGDNYDCRIITNGELAQSCTVEGLEAVDPKCWEMLRNELKKGLAYRN